MRAAYEQQQGAVQERHRKFWALSMMVTCGPSVHHGNISVHKMRDMPSLVMVRLVPGNK